MAGPLFDPEATASGARPYFAARRPVWRAAMRLISRSPSAMSAVDAAVLAETESWSAQIAAAAHLFVVLVIASLVLLAVRTAQHENPLVVGLLVTDLAVAICGLRLAHGGRFGAWLSWAAGLLDVGVIMGVVVETVGLQDAPLVSLMPTHTGLWAVFLTLSLSALRGRPVLLLVQTLVFAAGLGLVTVDLHFDASAAHAPGAVATAFGPARNTVRVAATLVAGMMLIVVTLRARINLGHAIVAARRAANLSRYLAPSVAAMVADADIAALRDGREQNAAILFADVRGFSTLAETMPPREIAAFLNAFRRHAVAAIEREGGVIDKFIGDEVMGLFGVPSATTLDAERAIRAALRLLAAVEGWNVERAAAALPSVSVGIGIHYGPVFTGVLGDDRLEFTVLGSTVNIARRLEELTKTLACDCIVSAAAVMAAQVERKAGWSCRSLPPQPIRGHREPVGVFALGFELAGCAGPVESRATVRPQA